MAKKVTVKDIANLAGVSTGTVSRAFNHAAGIDPELVEKVRQAAAELQYSHGKKRDGSRCGALAAIWPSPNGGLTPESSSVAGYLKGIAEGCRARGYDMILRLCSAAELEDSFESALRSCDGVLLRIDYGMDGEKAAHLKSLAARTPVVGFGTDYPWFPVPQISFDNYAGGMLVAEELLRLGHRRIAFVNSEPAHPMFVERSLGFMASLKRNGLWSNELLIEGDFRSGDPQAPPEMERALETVLALKATAVVTANDWGAAGLYDACGSRGVSIPESLSVASFDNESYCQALSPQLSSMEIPFGQIGRLAAEWLSGIIEGRISHPEGAAPIQRLPGVFHKRASAISPLNLRS